MRKAQYQLLMKLKNNTESEATLFGSAIHKALETWYCLPFESRELTDKQAKVADTLINTSLSQEPQEGALEAIRQFVIKAEPLLWLGDGDKRSVHNGIKILKAYFKHYLNDGLEVMHDSKGPIVEREVEFKLYEDETLVITYHGTIDAVLRNTISGQIIPVDHKTTSSLGTQFYNRIKPNHQYTGYVMGAQQVLGLNTEDFLVNGIQVAKTKAEFARQLTTRTEEDKAEMIQATLAGARQLINAIESDNFPMSAPNACTNYGSCQYLAVCSSPKKLRNTIISSQFGVQNG